MIPRPIVRNVRIILGTDKLTGAQCIEYVQRGLAAGYRRIDTAQVYMNEEAIGQAVRGSSISREQIHVTTKISHGFKRNPGSVEEALDSARRSLTRLGLGYVDTILIHHPGDDSNDPEASNRRRVTWQALEEMVGDGVVKTIGVSNFDVAHLQDIQRYARISPCVNQLELHPCCQRRKIVEFCKKHQIQLQAYLAIARNSYAKNETLQNLAEKYNVSTAQMLLGYSLRKGYSPIVKATSLGHLASNMEAEDLQISDEDIALMDSWDKGDDGSLMPWLMGPS